MENRPGVNEVTAGWYPDPSGRFESRFHNGNSWTADVSNNGERFVDPLGTAPSVAGQATTPTPLPPGQTGTNKPATAAMVLGIVAVATAWMPMIVVLGGLSAILALVYGAIGLRQSKISGTGRAFSLTGLITGAVGLALCVVGIVLSVIVFDAIDHYQNPAENSAGITSCGLDGRTATLAGEITNLSDHDADFSINVAFVRAGTDNVQRGARVAVDNVPPGETVVFDAESSVAIDDIDCIIQSVDGPLPFGLEVD